MASCALCSLEDATIFIAEVIFSVLLTDAHGNQQLVYKAKISTIAMHSGRPAVSIQRARKPRVSMAPRPHGAPSRYDDNQGGGSEQ